MSGTGHDACAEAVIESPTQSYPSFSRLDFGGITVNGRVFDSCNPFGLSSGQYAPSALQNGAFSLLPDGFIQRPSSVKRPAHIHY